MAEPPSLVRRPSCDQGGQPVAGSFGGVLVLPEHISRLLRRELPRYLPTLAMSVGRGRAVRARSKVTWVRLSRDDVEV